MASDQSTILTSLYGGILIFYEHDVYDLHGGKLNVREDNRVKLDKAFLAQPVIFGL